MTDDLRYIEKRIRDTENEIADVILDIEMSRSMQAIWQHPDFIAMVKRLREIIAGETAMLVSQRLDEYQLGRKQGRIRAIQQLCTEKALTDDELAACRERIADLRARLEEDRNLLR